jgi:hypothetical protein
METPANDHLRSDRINLPMSGYRRSPVNDHNSSAPACPPRPTSRGLRRFVFAGFAVPIGTIDAYGLMV